MSSKMNIFAFIFFIIVFVATLYAEKAFAGGTSFFITNDGYVITNQHVVTFAKTSDRGIFVLYNDQYYSATVISEGIETNTDLALLKIHANTPCVSIGEYRSKLIGGQMVNLVSFSTRAKGVGLTNKTERKMFIERYTYAAFVGGMAPSGIYYLLTPKLVIGGNSGSPLLDEKNMLVGVINATSSPIGNDTAVTNYSIHKFLDNTKLILKCDKPTTNPINILGVVVP